MRECVRFAGQNTQATVSRLADGWYLSILVNTDTVLPGKNHRGVLGVDLGVKALAVLSSGDTIAGPKALRVLMPRLQRLSRAVSRKVKGSANRKKAVMRLGRLHKRITDVRSDGLHKLTTRLATEYDVIGIEDLHVAGMLKNRCLARAVSDQGWGEFRRQLDYKAAMTGAQVVVVDRWFPSTKTCSGCGALHDMSLSKRRMSCACGLELDRDLNAAINIATLAASLAVTACGAKGADGGCKTAVKPFAMKQEELHEISA